MPDAWSNKDERQYEHIKESELERGKPEETAEEIAARTVNKQRRLEGRTPNERTEGTGNPNLNYEDRTRDELENLARERGIEVSSATTKEELIETLRE